MTITKNADCLGYQVNIQQVSGSLGDLPEGIRNIDKNTADNLKSTFKEAKDTIETFASGGSTENVIGNSAATAMKEHAKALFNVLKSETIWDKDYASSWDQLKEEAFFFIELVVCADMQKYFWEALCLLDQFDPAKVAIVRRPESDSKKASITEHANSGPLKLALLSARANLPLLLKMQPEIQKKWTLPDRSILGESEITLLGKIPANPNLIFLFIGHGILSESGEPLLQLDENREGKAISPTELGRAFQSRQRLILILVACGVGFGAAAINNWLKISPIVVAMQSTLSDKSAVKFLEGFLDGDVAGTDLLLWLEGLAKQVAKARHAMYKEVTVEAAIPVILSRVSVLQDFLDKQIAHYSSTNAAEIKSDIYVEMMALLKSIRREVYRDIEQHNVIFEIIIQEVKKHNEPIDVKNVVEELNIAVNLMDNPITEESLQKEFRDLIKGLERKVAKTRQGEAKKIRNPVFWTVLVGLVGLVVLALLTWRAILTKSGPESSSPASQITGDCNNLGIKYFDVSSISGEHVLYPPRSTMWRKTSDGLLVRLVTDPPSCNIPAPPAWAYLDTVHSLYVSDKAPSISIPPDRLPPGQSTICAAIPRGSQGIGLEECLNVNTFSSQ